MVLEAKVQDKVMIWVRGSMRREDGSARFRRREDGGERFRWNGGCEEWYARF